MIKYKTRKDIFDFLNEYASETKNEIDEKFSSKTLLKAYVIETANLKQFKIEEFSKCFKGSKKIVDENLLAFDDENDINYIEKINSRFWIVYSLAKSENADKKINEIIKNQSPLDNLWLSGIFYDSLWNNIIKKFSDNRIIKMRFDYEDKYGIYNNSLNDTIRETQSSSINFTFRNKILKENLLKLKNLIPDFYCMNSLRYPSTKGTGGSDFYFNGKVTNRSSSFMEYRNQIKEISLWYQRITESIENNIWLSLEKDVINHDSISYSLKGAPVYIYFEDDISHEKYLNFIHKVFYENSGPFRIWGNPIRISDECYQIYGIDMHLCNELYIEITPKRMIIILPKNSCGNTINRIVTNIQKYYCPKIKIMIGNTNYMDLLKESRLG